MRCPCGTFKSLNIFLVMKKVMHMHWAMHTEEALGYHFWLILRPCTSSKLDLRQNCQLSGRAGKASLNTYTETLGKKKNRGDLPPSSYQLMPKITEQKLQWPHMTKNRDFTELFRKSNEKPNSNNSKSWGKGRIWFLEMTYNSI